MANLLNTLTNKIQGTELTPVELPENFFKNILDKSDREPNKGRAGTYSEHVHVSSLAYDFCPRQYAIAKHEKLALYESLTGGHKVTFAIGRAVEHHIREAFIEAYGRDKIYAKWSSESGQFRHGLWKDTQGTDGLPLDNFNEADIQDDVHGVKGHPDLIFLRKGKLHVVEIKSIKKETNANNVGWDDLTAPLPAHLKQAGMYPYLLSKQTPHVSPIVTYIYCTKDFKWGSPYKEYHVNSNDEQYVKQRTEALLEAKQIKDYMAGGATPGRICPSQSYSLAKKCPVAFRCFNVYKDEVR